MKIYEKYLDENKNFTNWVRYTSESIKMDFLEYKKKEDNRWKNRAHLMGFRFPLFPTLEDFKKDLDNSPIIALTHSMDYKIKNRSRCTTLKDLKSLVSIYKRPRDVEYILQGYQSNSKMPMPIVIQGERGPWIMAGNTRLDTAFIIGIKPKVLWLDLRV